eukprot:CAMPEP_0204571712 /NCGR_PEP_ID=MMETSP0661-20131031/39043_1 /ASSEMBLY_ACC=CAM_ASM_000606 /TAXON_ID=109239 /ORGANISM="Alexandrium margalefi, Strain AMGDE01CS-322" /LENGTH=98 /DNA_ID=CAMNT_0051579993 /DNA_START=128 /DNA_END=420 /DNA_ORIENTATION=-
MTDKRVTLSCQNHVLFQFPICWVPAKSSASAALPEEKGSGTPVCRAQTRAQSELVELSATTAETALPGCCMAKFTAAARSPLSLPLSPSLRRERRAAR